MLIYNNRTPHHEIKVVDIDDIRYLIFGTGITREQSAIKLSNLDEDVFEYSKIALLSLHFISNISSILIVGLGGGIIPRQINKFLPEVHVDVLEIDPEVIKIAEEFFYFKTNEKVHVHVGDALLSIKNLGRQYDIIIVDAFGHNYTPFPLMSVEFLRDIKERCSKTGIVVFNTSPAYVMYNSQIRTLFEVFEKDIYSISNSQNYLNNMIFCLQDAQNQLKHFSLTYRDIKVSEVEQTRDIKEATIFSVNKFPKKMYNEHRKE